MIASWIRRLLSIDNVMTKFIVSNRRDALKTDINLFFYDNKILIVKLSALGLSAY